jgi:hypothetical protein
MARKSNDPVYEMRMKNNANLSARCFGTSKTTQDAPHKFDRLYFLFSGDGMADIAPALEEFAMGTYQNRQ